MSTTEEISSRLAKLHTLISHYDYMQTRERKRTNKFHACLERNVQYVYVSVS